MSEHKRMDCTEVEAHLALFIGGDLEAPLEALVGAHLGACKACGVRLEAARGARSALLGLAELEGGAGAVDLWPGVRASLVAEGICAATATPPAAAAIVARTARMLPMAPALSFARAFVGLAAAAALALFLWHSLVPERVGGGGQLAGSALPIETDLPDGLVVPVGGPVVAEPTPAWPSFLEGPSSPSGLRRAGPEDELLRSLARPFPDPSRRIYPIRLHGQGDWSLAGEEELR